MTTLIENSKYVSTLAGVKMPKIIYGTAWKKEKTRQYVVDAILSGFRGIDTAGQPKHYQEHLVGEALTILATKFNLPRSEIFLQTKFTAIDGQDPKSIPYDPRSKIEDQLFQSFEKSLKNLRTDYIDSFLLHSPMKRMADTLNLWSALESLYEKGLVKQLGISNIYSIEQLRILWDNVKIKPSVVQNRFYEQTFYDMKIRNFCREKGIVYQSFWTLTANPRIVNSEEVAGIAKKRNCTQEMIMFKLVMQLGIVPLTGTTNVEHMKQDLQVLSLEDLTKEEMKVLRKMIGDDTDTYYNR